jgi:hypothetical protein
LQCNATQRKAKQNKAMKPFGAIQSNKEKSIMNLDLLEALDLTPGSVIPQADVESIIGFTLNDDPQSYSFKVLELISVIERLSSVQCGDRTCKAKQDKGSIRVLTTKEIAGYFDKQQRAIRDQLKRSTRYLENQNESELTPDEKEQLRQTRLRAHYMLSKCKKAAKKYPAPKPKKLVVQPDNSLSLKSRKRFT